MKKDVSIEQFQIDAKKYKVFFLSFHSPRSPLDFSAKFEKIAVNIFDCPYVVLKNDSSEATLRHIQSIKKYVDGAISTYVFICNDYTNIKSPAQKEIVLECI